MDREVRFCTTDDGVRIAYCSEGTGPPLIMCPSRGESFSLTHLSPELEAFLQRLGQGRRIIRYDERGTGLSQREIADRSHGALVSDLAAVADAVGAETFSLWASTLSGPRAIGYAAQHPDRVERMVLYGTLTNPNAVFAGGAAAAYASLARIDWKMWSRAFIEISCNRKYPDQLDGLSDMLFQSTTGENAAATLVEGSADADVTAIATTLTMPVLVAHGTEDQIVQPQHGFDLAALIPNVQFMSLNGAVSFFFLGETEQFMKAVNEFLPVELTQARGHRDTQTTGSVRTILYTDLANRATLMNQPGATRWREVLRDHERITRATLLEHGGTQVKAMGDGFMASFASPSAAMDCALALQRANANRKASSSGETIAVRVGLNAGEPADDDGDLFGATVLLAARIAGHADGGEILVPEPVRHLLAGKDFTFGDRGDFVPKGFEDAVRLFEVRWQS